MLAYYDTIGSGLVPVRVRKVYRRELGIYLDVIVTSKRGAYERGEYLNDISATRIVPRNKVRRRKYQTVILPYSWAEYVK